MLGKLIKHEWKALTKVGLILIAVNLFVTIVESIYYFSPLWQNGFVEAKGEIETAVHIVLGVGGLIFVSLVVTGTIYAIYIFIAIRYYKSMFSTQGYLTNTLPVSVHKLLWARIFVGTVWAVLVTLACFTALGTSLYAILSTTVTMDGSAAVSFWQGFQNGLELFDITFGEGEFYISVILVATFFLITTVGGMIRIFAAFAIGQLSNKHKALVGTVVCLGFYAMEFLVYMMVGMTLFFEALMEVTAGKTYQLYSIGIISLIVNIVVAAALYFVTSFILKKKLNLD